MSRLAMDAKETGISHQCLIKFQFIYNNLKSAERKAADFCLKNPESITNSTIGEAAAQIGCSEATLVRLARHLGYNGYPELRKNILLKECDDVTAFVNVSAADSVYSIATNVFNSCMLYLQDSLQALDEECLEDAADLLMKADRFLFVATGDAHFAAASGAQKFTRLGYPTCSSSDFDSQLLALSQMDENDVVICISHSGRTRNVCSLAKFAHEKGVKVISITNFPVSPLAKSSDIILLTASFAYDMMDEIIAKRVPALCILDVLYIFLLVKRQDYSRQALERTKEYLRFNKS